MAARTPSIHVFHGRPLFLLSPGIHSIINFGSLSSCILLMWPYYWSLFLLSFPFLSFPFLSFPFLSFPLIHSAIGFLPLLSLYSKFFSIFFFPFALLALLHLPFLHYPLCIDGSHSLPPSFLWHVPRQLCFSIV